MISPGPRISGSSLAQLVRRGHGHPGDVRPGEQAGHLLLDLGGHLELVLGEHDRSQCRRPISRDGPDRLGQRHQLRGQLQPLLLLGHLLEPGLQRGALGVQLRLARIELGEDLGPHISQLRQHPIAVQVVLGLLELGAPGLELGTGGSQLGASGLEFRSPGGDLLRGLERVGHGAHPLGLADLHQQGTDLVALLLGQLGAVLGVEQHGAHPPAGLGKPFPQLLGDAGGLSARDRHRGLQGAMAHNESGGSQGEQDQPRCDDQPRAPRARPTQPVEGFSHGRSLPRIRCGGGCVRQGPHPRGEAGSPTRQCRAGARARDPSPRGPAGGPGQPTRPTAPRSLPTHA